MIYYIKSTVYKFTLGLKTYYVERYNLNLGVFVAMGVKMKDPKIVLGIKILGFLFFSVALLMSGFYLATHFYDQKKTELTPLGKHYQIFRDETGNWV